MIARRRCVLALGPQIPSTIMSALRRQRFTGLGTIFGLTGSRIVLGPHRHFRNRELTTSAGLRSASAKAVCLAPRE